MRALIISLMLASSVCGAIEPRKSFRTEAKKPTSYLFLMKTKTRFYVAVYEETKTEYLVRLTNGIGTKLAVVDVESITPLYGRTNARGEPEPDSIASEPTLPGTDSSSAAKATEVKKSDSSSPPPEERPQTSGFDENMPLATIRHKNSPHRSGRRTTARENLPPRVHMETPYYDANSLFGNFNGGGGGYSGGGRSYGGGGPVHVRGHYRDGHWVNPYTRSRPSR